MSKVLSYNSATTRTDNASDWIPVEPYNDDNIAQIQDPDGGLSENPRTAIPSPFAQLDLVKTAFKSLCNDNLQGPRMNERLVSNALDVAQLFFDYENHKDYLRIVRWNRETELQRLLSNPEHRLYGETLQLFLNSDTVYNFDRLTDWYILLWGDRVVGGTSPSSFTMGAPGIGTIDAIKVEQGVSLFSNIRHLWERDEEFVFYLYILFNAFTDLRRSLPEVYGYMLKNVDRLRQRRPELYERITREINNLSALSPEKEHELRELLNRNYDPFSGENNVTVLGAMLFHKRVTDIRTAAQQSDFVMRPTIEQPAGTELPLVLRSNFDNSGHYRYIDKEWDSSTVVLAGNVPLEQRKLPNTSIQYPFITTSDLLSDNLVRLSNAIDSDHYFDGNLVARDRDNGHGYLLPLKPLYFKYFKVETLLSTIDGRNAIDMVENHDGSVTVTLRIPINKRHIELSRVYKPIADPQWTPLEVRGEGRVVDATMTVAVFPFVRTQRNDDYTVQLFTMPGTEAQLNFYREGMTQDELMVNNEVRTSDAYVTRYYDIDGTFDYMTAQVSTSSGDFTAFIVPRWAPYAAGNKELVFAVDFGTTNSHVEWAQRGQVSEPLTFDYSSRQTLVASLLRHGGLDIADQLQRIEFLPREIDNIYGFPLRTSLMYNENAPGENALFRDVNIPFLYERQYFNGDRYDVITNLKWNADSETSLQFLREIILLIKAKVLLENASLEKTHIVYFFPVSMGASDRNKLNAAWNDLFNTYIGGESRDLLKCYPESIAPAFYYKGAEVAGSSYVSIDIGGGTSDVVIYQPTADGMQSVPVAISSFRFAGNAIFGDAFNDRDADSNPLVQHWSRYFHQLIDSDKGNKISYLNSILADIMKQKRSEDINAFLFSIENVEQLRDLRPIDRKNYSYNALLADDNQRKLVFMYFYAAIIYYIASAMKARNYQLPKQIYFSGTGSKILNILGNTDLVTYFTRRIIEGVYGSKCDPLFTIRLETKCPKEITCRGGIKLENERLDGQQGTALFSPQAVREMKYCYSMIGDDQLKYERLMQQDTRDALADKVKEFNKFFVDLCDRTIRDEFGIESNVLAIFTEVVNDSVSNFLTEGLNRFLKDRYEPAETIEDVPFFYPIVGIIRYNLLKNLTNEVISHRNN